MPDALTRFFNRKQLHCAIFFHVEALRLNGIQVTVDKAILNFFDRHKTTIEAAGQDGSPITLDAARRAYHRMLKEYNEISRSNGST